MARERKKNRGICIGLVVGNNGKSICGGIYPALERGECRILSFENDSNAPEVLEFTNTLVNTFIKVDRQWGNFLKKT